jgi:hypothetical protein
MANTETIDLREYPIPTDAQTTIASCIFGSDRADHLSAYFRYLNRQCRQVVSIAMVDSTVFPFSSIADLLEELKATLSAKHGGTVSDDVLQVAMDLAMRLLLMFDIGVFSNAYSGRESVAWETGTVGDFIRKVPLFDGRPVIPCDGIKLESFFNACNLELIGGLEVQLTSNLNDHLLLAEDARVVYIFHHAGFLKSHIGYVCADP